MRRTAICLALLASPAVWAQVPVTARGNVVLGGPGWNVNQVPLFGSPYGGLRYGSYFGSGYAQQLYSSRVSGRAYDSAGALLGGNGLGNPWLYGYLWGGYWNRPANQIPASPSYANPAVAQPAEQVARLIAPDKPAAVGATQQAAWSEVQSAFESASISVVAAQQAVEDLRARLAALGQSPRANLSSSAANAEAALKRAQQHMSAGALQEAHAEIQRAGAMARQLLKEFGR